MLLTRIRMAVRERDLRSWTIGHIGGFDLTCRVHRALLDNRCTATLILRRTDFDQEIEISNELTSLGLISRLEHVLDRFEDELEEQTRRKADAAARLRGYEPRLDQPFPCRPNSTRSWRAWRS